jgi:ribose-phosphate pyrophosphokinase
MKYLNLTEGFNPFNANPTDCIAFEAFTFKGGEPHIKIKGIFKDNTSVQITIRINSFNDLGLLLLAKNALDAMGWLGSSYLLVPYFPGARQDRRMIYGEPLTVKVYADIINNMNFTEVKVLDPHSDVTAAVLNNITIIPNYKLVKKALHKIYPTTEINVISWGEEFHLISPDAGANKKITSLGIYLGAESIIKCDKTRDVSNGKITGFEVYSDNLKGRPCILVDDICDGGGTFLGLSKELKAKNAGDIHLIVSHGIFSKGLHQLENEFKSIWTTDSISKQLYGLDTHCIKISELL